MEVFVPHPSVRLLEASMKFEPLPCLDRQCVHSSRQHMHCPFCPQTDIFTDPAILRAHYGVKHIDKGIEFGGLKMARCCDNCSIEGFVKFVKMLKGGHWHCFRCNNGFNRRDEAIKHYQTHFKCPKTTFQIQIDQEVYPPHVVKAAAQIAAVDKRGSTTSSPATRYAIITPLNISSSNDESLVLRREVQECVGANETVSTSGVTSSSRDLDLIVSPSAPQLTCARVPVQGTDKLSWQQQKAVYEAEIEDLVQKNKQLVSEKEDLQRSLLFAKMTATCSSCGKQSAPLGPETDGLLRQLSREHADLLQTHLLRLQSHCATATNTAARSCANFERVAAAAAAADFVIDDNGAIQLQLMVPIAGDASSRKLETSELVDCFPVDDELGSLADMTKDDYFGTSSDVGAQRKRRRISQRHHGNGYASSPETDCIVEVSECS